MMLLGLDYGLRKVGLAVVDTESKLAEPITVVQPNEVIGWIRQNHFKYPIDEVVIGLTNNVFDKTIRTFADQIKTELDLPVSFSDETLSTQDAQGLLRATDTSRKKIKKLEDAVAAAIMLQSYLERGKDD